MFVCLPQAEDRAGWVLDHAHTASVHHVKSRSKHLAAQLPRPGHSVVCALYRYIKVPVRGHVLFPLFFAQSQSCSGIASIKVEDRIKIIRTHWTIVRSPAKQAGIELLRGRLIAGAQLNPAE